MSSRTPPGQSLPQPLEAAVHYESGPVPAGRRRGLQAALSDARRRQDDLQRSLAEAVELADGDRRREQAMFDRLPIGVVELDAAQGCTWANRAFLDTVGRQLPDVLGLGWHTVVHRADLLPVADLAALAELAGAAGLPDHRRARFLRPDGPDVLCDVKVVAGPGDGDPNVLLSVSEVDRATSSARTTDVQDTRHRRFFENAAVAEVVIDLEGVVVAVNSAFTRLTGFPEEELLGRRLHEVVLSTTGYYDLPALARTLHADGTARTMEAQSIRRDRSVFWSKVTMFPTLDEEGSPAVVAQHVEVDVLPHHAVGDRAEHRDELTGLPNRASLLSTLTGSLAQRYGFLTVVYCDLDRFKAFNDVLGHNAGDELLLQATERLRSRMRPGDVLARPGGDEFVLLLPGTDEDQAAAVAAELQTAFATTFLVEDEEVTCGISLGLCVLDLGRSPGLAAASVLDDAETAMTEAKDAGRGTSRVFSPRMRDKVLRRSQVEQDLRRGIAAGELRVHYQPVVRLVDGRRTGYEALVRWEHPDRGLLLPADFLDVAEESGLSRSVDTFVLGEAVDFLARHPGVSVAVNVSPRRLDGSFTETVLLRLARNGVEANRLSVELRETSLLTIDTTTTRELQSLSAAGCELLIDDFGTGYSALSYLRRLPVGGLKLDRSFVADLPHDENADRIAAAVAGLASGFGMRSVAEGVESALQAAHLRAQGWTCAQGWFFGRPAPEETWYPARRPTGEVPAA